MVGKEAEEADQIWFVVSHRRPFTIAAHYFEGSSGQAGDFSDWKSMVKGGVYYMDLLTAITLRNDSLPGFTITILRRPYKSPLIFQTHAAHITSSIVKFLLFHIAGLCLLMASLELIQDRGLMANLTPSPEDYF